MKYIGKIGNVMVTTKSKVLLICLFWVLMIILFSSCAREYNHVHIKKKPDNVVKSDEYLSNQAVKVTQENIDNADNRKKKSEKRSEKEQDRLNELNKSPYKVKTKKVNNRIYDIYE